MNLNKQIQETLGLKFAGKTVRFACQKGCAKCCLLPVFLTAQEASLPVFQSVAIRTKFGIFLAKRPDGKCIFLKRDRCSIYPLRPTVCKSYPFYLDSNSERVFLDPACSGIGAGERIDLLNLKLHLLDREKLFNPPPEDLDNIDFLRSCLEVVALLGIKDTRITRFQRVIQERLTKSESLDLAR